MAMPELGDIRGEAHDRARALLDEVRADPEVSAVHGAEQVAVTLVVSERPAAPELVDRSRDAVLLVVGSRGRGAVRSALLGSVALHCATHAACPVVVVHPAAVPAGRTARVVVGVDGSAGSLEALTAAIEEAARLGATVDAVTTYQSAEDRTDLESMLVPSVEAIRSRLGDVVREQLDAALTEVARRGIAPVPEVRIGVVEGAPGEVLTRRARGADLLVVGCRGRGAFRALLLGSIALDCVIHAPCPVMVVHPEGERAAADGSRPAMVSS
jgi:nucleotide-binding universal stress UspA family protein